MFVFLRSFVASTLWPTLRISGEVHSSGLLSPERSGSRRLDSAVPIAGVGGLLLLTVAIFFGDIFWPRTNLSVLYILPLLLLARGGGMHYASRLVVVLIGLTYVAYLIKKSIDPAGAATSYFHFSLMNRTLVVLMLMGVALLMRFWVRWNEDLQDPEMPQTFLDQDRDIRSTLAIVSCAALALAIAAIDLCSPANYNVAILYPVPLLLCVWTRSRRMLWTMLAAMLGLALLAHKVGPPSTETTTLVLESLSRNRVIAVCNLVVVAVILDTWLLPTAGREKWAQ